MRRKRRSGKKRNRKRKLESNTGKNKKYGRINKKRAEEEDKKGRARRGVEGKREIRDAKKKHIEAEKKM